MKKLNSPLTSDELTKIDVYVDININQLSKLSLEIYENIKAFQPKVSNFDQYLENLTENEKTRAWFYLFTASKKERQKYLKVAKNENHSIEAIPSYLDTSTVQYNTTNKRSKFILNIIGVMVLFLITFLLFSFMGGSKTEVMSGEFSTMDNCLNAIEQKTGKKLEIITDKLGDISGFLTNTKLGFQCKTEATGTKGIIVKGWYEAEK